METEVSTLDRAFCSSDTESESLLLEASQWDGYVPETEVAKNDSDELQVALTDNFNAYI